MNIFYQTPAIVLAVRDEREADRVITFYTKDFGKIRTFARGVRFMKSKLRGHIVPGALLRIAFVEGKESYHLVDAEILSRSDIMLNARACQFLDMVAGEHAAEGELWQFLLNWLLDPPAAARHERAGRKEDMAMFQARVLALLGFLPRDVTPSPQVIQSALIANHLA